MVDPNNLNLFPGTKFLVKNSESVYILVGYTENQNIVYVDESLNSYHNNLIVSDSNIINTITFTPNLSSNIKTFKFV